MKKILYGIWFLISFLILVFALLVNNYYYDITNYIVNDLNSGASLNNYELFIKGFIIGGNIEIIKSNYIILTIILSFISMYLSIFSFMNGFKNIKNIFKKSYFKTLKYKEFKYKFNNKDVDISSSIEHIRKEKDKRRENELKLKELKIKKEKESGLYYIKNKKT